MAEMDTNVLGFVLCGSRGKGFPTDHSDYDCAMIVTNETCEMYVAQMRELASFVDVSVYTLQGFAEHAAWNSELVWDRYNWAHLRAQVDKTDGKIQAIIDEKGKVPTDIVTKFVRDELDHYINQVYRSIKCFRDGNTIGHHFEAADSIKPLLDVIFAIHDRRLRPYYKYLEWELREFPLYKFLWTANQLLEMIQTILTNGSYTTQQDIFEEVERVLRADGYSEVFDSWGESLWIRDYTAEMNGKSKSNV
ncbi:MAG: hypothetical protein AB1489_10385 [Acidobacteriota bacterium]